MSNNEKMQEYKDKLLETPIISAIYHFKKDFANDKKQFLIKEIVALVISIFIGGVGAEWVMMMNRDIEHIYFDPGSIIYAAFVKAFLFTLIVFLFAQLAVFYIGRVFEKDEYYDAERGITFSKKGTNGGACFFTKEDYDRYVLLSKDINDNKEDLLGLDDSGNLVSIKPGSLDNKNAAIFGASGSKKTVSYVIPNILQMIRRGESIIVTDTKGDIYMKLAQLAKNCGYIVRVLDLKPKELKFSDAVNFMSIIRGDEITADSVKDCIMVNTNEDGKQDFFYKAEGNLLKALILLISLSEDIPEEEKTLGKVYEYATKPIDEVDALFAGIKPTHPAYGPYTTFQSEKNSREDALSGLGIRLQFMSSSLVKQVLGHNEIDLGLPANEKCIYFCIFSDTIKQYRVLSSLFFTELFIELTNEAEKREEEDGVQETRIPVNFMIDEAKACGAIPGFDDLMSTIRSKNISAKFIVQDKTQLERMYPDKASNTILNNCSLQILLNTSEEDSTAAHFNKLCGKATTVQKNDSYNEAKTDILKIHNVVGKREGEGQRDLMTLDEIMKTGKDGKMLIYVSGVGPLKVKKLPYYENYPGSKFKYTNDYHGKITYTHPHPLVEFIESVSIRKHVPDWYESYEKNISNEKIRQDAESSAPIKTKYRP